MSCLNYFGWTNLYKPKIYTFPAGICLLKVNIRNTRTRCEICSKLTIKTPKRRQWRRSGVFIVNFEHVSHLVLVFLLLTLNMQLPVGLGFLINSSMHNVKMWPNILLESSDVNIARFLKYVWSFFNNVHERVKALVSTRHNIGGIFFF